VVYLAQDSGLLWPTAQCVMAIVRLLRASARALVRTSFGRSSYGRRCYSTHARNGSQRRRVLLARVPPHYDEEEDEAPVPMLLRKAVPEAFLTRNPIAVCASSAAVW
jgi:hypothetical protein